jgi:acetyl esterase/lipase
MPTTTRYSYGSHREQIADLTVPDGSGPFPVLIMFHGGGFAAGPTLDRLTPLCADLADNGLATWNVEYRRLEGTEGGWPMTWADAAAATDYLVKVRDQHQLDLNRVAAFGHSAGAPLALWLASRGARTPLAELGGAPAVSVRAAVAAAGVCDFGRQWPERLQAVFHEIIGGSLADVPERYAAISPVQFLPVGVPLLVVQGAVDTTVPSSFSEEFAAAATAAGDTVTLLIVDGAEHSDVRDAASPHWPSVRTCLVEFLEKTLTGIQVAA